MPLVTLSSTNRALIAIAVILLIGGAAIGVYYFHQHRIAGGTPPGLETLQVSSENPPDLLSLLPADAPAVGFVDVAALRALQNSPLGAILGLTSPGPQADREYAEFVRETGFDYTRDLDKAAIAFWPQSFGTASGPGQNRLLAVADGRFDKKKIETYALRTGRTVITANQTIYEVPGNPPVSFTFISLTRISIASGKNAGGLIEQSLHPTKSDSVMQTRIERVAGAPIFAVARIDKLPESFYANFANAPQLEKLARSVRSLTLAGKPQGDVIKAALDGECDSMKNAFEIATLLDGFRMVGSMALSDPKTLRQMTKEQAQFLKIFIRQLKITHQDNWVRMNLDITPQMLGAQSVAASDPAPANSSASRPVPRPTP